MIFNAKSEPAVSPVIGTILLVAIAVVLVAIILAVVMGFAGDPNEKKVGLNAKPESGANATLILYGGASIDELVKLEMIDQGSANGSYVKFWDISEDGDAFVGMPYLAEGVAQPERSMAVYDTRINVRGTFSDGTEVILLVQPMTFYDVAGFGDGNTKLQSFVDVSAPKFIKTALLSSVSQVRVSFTYSNTTETPDEGIIYYQPKEGGEILNATAMRSDTTFTATLTGLTQDTEYYVWGAVVMPDGGVATGPKGKWLTTETYVKVPYNSVKDYSGFVRVTFLVYYPDPSITDVIFWYQPIDGGVPVSAAAKRTAVASLYHYYEADMTDLKPGTYLTWVEITLSNGNILESDSAKVTTNVNNIIAPTASTSSNGVAVTYTINYFDPEGDALLWYQLKNGGTAEFAATNVYGQTDVRRAILTLGPGTYLMWGEVTLPSGKKITGPSREITTTANNVNTASVSSISAGNATVRFKIDYPDSSAISVLAWYEPVEDGTAVPVETTVYSTSSSSTSYEAVLTGLDPGKNYRAWGEITLSNGKKVTGTSRQFTAK